MILCGLCYCNAQNSQDAETVEEVKQVWVKQVTWDPELSCFLHIKNVLKVDYQINCGHTAHS